MVRNRAFQPRVNICTNNFRSQIFSVNSFNDGYLEVMGLYSSLHIGKLQVNLAEPLKLGRAKTVKV